MATSKLDSQSRSRSPPPHRSARRESYTPPPRDSRSRSRTPPRQKEYRHSRSRTPPRRNDRYPHSRSITPPRRRDRYSRSRSRSRTPSRRRDRDYPGDYTRSRSPRRYSPIRSRHDDRPTEQNRDRSRSRSPPRRRDAPRAGKGGGGFKWKEKPRQEDRDSREERGSYRGYRDRDPPRPRAVSPPPPVNGKDTHVAGDREPKKEKKKAAPKVAPVGQEMIIVNVNDRLGTKASIPCLASDPIRLFKAQVAARIGREPHEIMLKRQGERPFKDQLTLEDYGVSNGVQLDLEVDTGD